MHTEMVLDNHESEDPYLSSFLAETNDFFNYIKSWQNKPIVQWENEDVLNFINHETSLNCQDFSYEFNIEGFRSISGFIFQTLNEDYCKRLSGSAYIGETIFRAKEKFIKYQETIAIEENNNYISESRAINDSVKKEVVEGCKTRKSCNQKKGKTSKKLWEFLISLLKNSETCPNLIKWENYEEGTFKFVQSEKVAQIWGKRNKNENMNYEKFSRAMRYYYKSEILLPVYGKRLVYKFGPRAKGWRDQKPIC